MPGGRDTVEEEWVIDSRIGAVLHGDCFYAERVQDREDVVLWVSRKALSKEEQENFIQHLNRMMSVRDWGEFSCGVDAYQRGYIALNRGSTKAVDFDAPDTIVTRNRFLMCVALIAQIHQAGFSCGNITPGCFVVDSFGTVRLVGFMGGYQEEVSSTVSPEIRPFIRANEDIAGVPSAAADVYALAVMGLQLFGAKFPPESIDVRHLDTYLQHVNSDSPPWVLSVLAMILRAPQKQFCSDAHELLSAISVTDREYLVELVNRSREQKAPAVHEKPLAIFEIQEMLMTSKQLKKKRLNDLLHSKLIRGFIGGAIVFSVMSVIFLQASGLRGIIPNRRASGVEGVATLQDVKSVLALLRQGAAVSRESLNSAAGSVAVMEGEQRALLIAEGGTYVSKDVVAHQKISIEPDSILLKELSQDQLSADERIILFDLYADCDDDSKSRLARLVTTIGGESERQFRDKLIRQLQPSALIDQQSVQKLSTDALFLAAEGRLAKSAASVWGRTGELSNDELLWLLRMHGEKRSPVFAILSAELLKRKIIAPAREIFFRVAAATDEHSGAPYQVLFRGGTEEVVMADLQPLIDWTNPLAARALFAVVLSTLEPEIAASVIRELPAKSGVASLALEVIQVWTAAEDYDSIKLGKLVGALGLEDSISDELLVNGLTHLRGSPAQRLVVIIVLEKGSPRVVEAMLNTLGSEIHPDLLIQLLDRPETRIRKAVIPFLKEVSIASSKVRIRERYDEEQDPEVRRLFEVELFKK